MRKKLIAKGVKYMRKYVFCVFVALIVLAGCCNRNDDYNSQTDKPTMSGTNGSYPFEDNVYTEVIDDYVSIRIQLPDVQVGRLKEYEAVRTVFDPAIIGLVMMPENEHVEIEYISDRVTSYHGADSHLTVSNPGSISYITDTYANKVNSIVKLNDEALNYNGDLFNAETDLAFMTQKDATAVINRLIKTCGMQEYDIDKLFVLQHGELQMASDALSEAGELHGVEEETGQKAEISVSFGSNDNFYYFVMRQIIDGIKVFDKPHGDPDSDAYVPGTSMAAMLSESGVEFLSVVSEYSILSVVNEDVIISPLDAIKKISEKYRQQDTEETTIVHKISLEYVAEITCSEENLYTLRPAWVFDVVRFTTDVGTNEKVEIHKCVLIDAISGEEIL